MSGENDKFEVYQDKKSEWRWRRTASNGNIVGASSEGYKSRKDAEANMKRGHVPTDKWEFYQDKKKEWRWRRIAQNGRQVGKSSEGYKAKADAAANAARQGYQA
jgi:uncharacterized protein YegP (UPF0339 family)